MIHQIAPVAKQTTLLMNKGLIQARHIQARLRKGAEEALPTHVEILGPGNLGPYVVPVTRWIE